MAKTIYLGVLFLWISTYSIFSQNAPVTLEKKYSNGNTKNVLESNYDIELNLTQFDVSITIPANIPFLLPSIEDDSVALDINKQTYYSFNLDHLNRFFFFYKKGASHAALRMKIEPYANYIDEPEEPSLASINSNLGKSRNYIFNEGKINFHIYEFFYKDYTFSFFLDLNVVKSPKEQAIYKKIISSITAKDLSAEREKYERRLKYDYYKQQKYSPLKSDSPQKLDWIKGEVNQTVNFYNKLTGTTIKIPSGWSYMIEARNISDSIDGKHIYMEDTDFINNGSTSEIYKSANGELNLVLQLLNNNLFTQEGIVANERKGKEIQKSISTSTLGGISIDFYYFGSKTLGSILFFTNTDRGILKGILYGYTKENSDLAETILSSIRLHKESGSTDMSTPILNMPKGWLSSTFPLENQPEFVADKVQLPEPNTKNGFNINIEKPRLSFILPGESVDYLIIPQKNQKIPFSKGTIQKLTIDGSFSPIIATKALDVQLIFSPATDKDIKKSLIDTKDIWSQFAGVKNIQTTLYQKNNITWAIFIYSINGVYSAMANANFNNFEVQYNVSNSPSYKELLKKLAYLQTFSE